MIGVSCLFADCLSSPLCSFLAASTWISSLCINSMGLAIHLTREVVLDCAGTLWWKILKEAEPAINELAGSCLGPVTNKFNVQTVEGSIMLPIKQKEVASGGQRRAGVFDLHHIHHPIQHHILEGIWCWIGASWLERSGSYSQTVLGCPQQRTVCEHSRERKTLRSMKGGVTDQSWRNQKLSGFRGRGMFTSSCTWAEVCLCKGL